MTAANPAHATVTAALAQLDAWRGLYTNGVAPTHKRQIVIDMLMTATGDDGTNERGDENWVEYGYRGIEVAVTNFDNQLRNPDFDWTNEASRRNLIIESVDRCLKGMPDETGPATVFGIAYASYDPTWVDANDDYIEDVLQAPQLLTAPAITGTAEEGQTLTVSEGTWTDDDNNTYTYEWFRDGVLIAGETTSTYDLIETVEADPEATPPVEAVEGDAGKTIQARVTATNGVGSTKAFADAVEVAALA